MAHDQYWRFLERIRNPLTFWIAIGLLLLVWVGTDFKTSLDFPLKLKETRIFEVTPEDRIPSIALKLRTKGLLVEPLWFELALWLKLPQHGLTSGQYELPSGTRVIDLIDLLVAGKIRIPPIVVIEGWTFADMRSLLNRHTVLLHEAQAQTDAELLKTLGISEENPEGLFFPDTYFVGKKTTDLQILRQSHQKMMKILQDEWQNRSEGLPLETPYQALILASIVEKETGKSHERSQIAGVFIRRLKIGMRLQTDPTVIYGMKALYKGNITKADLERDTPWNTYTRKGLPPTPIALPGRQSIHAALHPDSGDALYFVSKGDGTHVFSATLEAHQKAVDHYQRHR